MSHHHPRRILMPASSRKRKETEVIYARKPPPPPPPPFTAAATTTLSKAPAEPVSSNRLLAGYLAHEFLTKGTLLGQKWDPARAEAVPVSNGSGEPKRSKPSAEAEPSRRLKQQQQQQQEQRESYADVARLLKEDGAHVPGIVNPTQLSRWIQM